jgi:ABC-type lipoprotein export system ATPase subunit
MVTHAPECAARASREIHLLDGNVIDLETTAAGEVRVAPVSARLASALA